MQYKFIAGIFFSIALIIPVFSAHAINSIVCVGGICSDPYNGLSTDALQNHPELNTSGLPQVKGLQPRNTPVVLQPVVIPPSVTATLGTNAVQCTLDPTSCKAALNAQAQCTQGGGAWTPYPMSSVLWPGSYCQTTTVPTATASHKSGLTTAQINSIISLLQAFGADASVIASVQVALGQ